MLAPFPRPLTDAEKLEAIEYMRRVFPLSPVLRLFTARPLPVRRADERLKSRIQK